MLGLLNFTSFMLTFDDSKVRVISKNPRFIMSQSSGCRAKSFTPKIDRLQEKRTQKMESTKDFQDEHNWV